MGINLECNLFQCLFSLQSLLQHCEPGLAVMRLIVRIQSHSSGQDRGSGSNLRQSKAFGLSARGCAASP